MNITGTADSDNLLGTDDNDTRDGAAGADTMIDVRCDGVTEFAGEGTDTIRIAVSRPQNAGR